MTNTWRVILDNKLAWNKCIRSIKSKVSSAYNSIKPLLKSDTLSIHNKLLLYNSCTLPIITYACPVCSLTCKTSMINLSRLHNKNLRTVRIGFRYFCNCTIRRELRTTTLRKRITDLSPKFLSKIYDLSNEIVAEVPDYNASPYL